MVKITNLTNRLVSLRLNNGKTLHLPPQTASGELVEAQVEHNAKVAKLRECHVIGLSDVRSQSPGEAGRSRGARAVKSSKISPSGSSRREGD
jgi:hypothetical protein